MPSATLQNDNFIDLATLLNLAPTARLRDGFLSPSTNGLTFVYPSDTMPTSTDPGTPIPAGASAGFGPLPDGYELRRLWVRNTTIGSNAVVSLNGMVA